MSAEARLERRKGQSGRTMYYLVKDLRVGTKKAKVTKYLGTDEPSPGQLEELLLTAAFELETGH